MKNLHNRLLKPVVVLIAFFFTSNTFANNFYWINGSGNWDDPSHWSTSSGGNAAMTVPGPNDNVIFDAQSFTQSYTQVNLSSSVTIHNLSISSPELFGILGIGFDLRVVGDIAVSENCVIEINKLVLDGAGNHSINAANADIIGDISFQNGNWNMLSKLEAIRPHNMEFVSGTLNSNGHTLVAEHIFANTNPYNFNLTGSTVFAYGTIDFSQSVNTGGSASFITVDSDVDNGKKGEFSSSNFDRDQTFDCGSGGMMVDVVSLDYNGGVNVTCDGVCDGEITLSAFGTPGGFSYSVDGSPFTAQTVYPNLCQGTRLIRVRDTSQIIGPGPSYFTCIFNEILNNPPTLTADLELAAPVDVSCFGVCDGQGFVSGIGGTNPYTYTWSTTAENTGFPQFLCAGDNDLHIEDDNGCTFDTTLVIGGPPLIDVTLNITEPICNGDNNGEVDVTPSGGNGPGYTFVWNPVPTSGQGSNPGIGFAAGSITLSVFDVDGCQFDTTFTMTEPPILSISALNVANASCFSVCDGQASSTPVGGAGNNTFEWFTCPKPGTTTGITDQNPNTLCAGDYYVIVTDNGGAGCSAESACITITEPTEIDAQAQAYDISCFGLCDGAVDVDATGGAGGYTFQWSAVPGGSIGITDSISNLCAGFYEAVVTDINGCNSTPDTVEVVEPPEITVNLATTHPTCFNVCDGSVIATPSGGVGGYTYNWSPAPGAGQGTATPSAMCDGIYTVTITDGNGCVLNEDDTLIEPTMITATLNITQPTCNGGCDGEVDVTPAGGNGPGYTFSWNPVPGSGIGSNPGIGFCAGSVTLSIFDVVGCQQDTTFTISEPPALTVSAAQVADATCFGLCNGQASATPAGGTGPYTYEWFSCPKPGATTGITSQNPNNLCAGDYYVIVTDASGCTAESGCITINEPTEVLVNSQSYDVSCFGVCDGATDSDPTGGTAPYTFSWVTVPGGLGVGASDSLSGLCPGFYEIIVTDDNGCVSTPDTVEVVEPPVLDATMTITDPSCYDLCDGDATINVTGGTGPFTYNWTPAPGIGQGTPNGTSMCAGIYIVDITDGNGCTFQLEDTLVAPPQYDVTVAQTNLQCFGDANGTIDLTINGGGSGAGYTFIWSPAPPIGQGTTSVSGLTAGSWCVTISDNQACDTIICITITEPTQLDVTASVISPISCFGSCDGSAQAVITGGTSPYNTSWTPSGLTTLVASSLCVGAHTVTVTDDNGCVANDIINLTQPAQYDIDTSHTDISCFGDCIATATAIVNSGGTGPYTWSWDDAPVFQSTPTAINLCAGAYTVTVSDQNLCDTTFTFNIIEPPVMVIDTNVINSTCFGTCTGEANVNVTGGTGPYTFEWFDAGTGTTIGVTTSSATNLCPGDYYVEVTDANLCVMLSDTMTISELPQINASVVSITDASCNVCDGSAEVLATGGDGSFTYTWTPAPGTGQGTTIATGLCDAVYSVVAQDGAGCTANIPVNVNSVAIETTSMDSTDASCFGVCDGTATISYNLLDPPYTVDWYDNLTGLPIGITDGPPASQPSTATGLCAGEYLAVLTNGSGCVTSDTIIVNEPPEIIGSIISTNVTCNGACDGTAMITASGGVGTLTYTWNPIPGGGQGTPTAVGLCTGVYDVTVTDQTGCSENFSANISEPTLLSIDALNSNDISCFGANDGTASVIHSGGQAPITYEWFDCSSGLTIGQTTQIANNLGPGTYQVVLTDANGCTQTSSCVIINEPASITATVNVSPVNCYANCDGVLDVVPGGGTAPYFYQWQDEFLTDIPGQTNDTMNNVCQGIYNVQITDFNGCTQSFGPFDMTSPTNPWNVTTSQTDISCNGSCDGTATATVLAGNTPPYTFLWDDPLVQTTATATNLCAGTYNLTISDAGTCDTTVTVTIIDATPIVANATINNVLCFGDCTGQISLAPSGGTAPYTVNWSDLQTGTTATGLCAGSITATITDASGCTYDTIVNITEPTELIVSTSFANNSACGLCNGSATVNPSGGVGPYTFLWSPVPGAGQGTNNATSLCPGVYSCTVTDANGCSEVEVFAISDISAETLTMDSTDVSCFGSCDGGVEVIYICSDPPCTNQWYDGTSGLPLTGETGTTVSNLCAGDYYVEVTNGSLCVSIGVTTVTGPTQILANETVNQISCNGANNGSIILAPSGGSGGGFTYTWSPVPGNGQGNSSATGLSPGTWCVDIIDSDGCIQNYCWDINQPTATVINPSVTDPSCNGSCNGIISVAVSGGWGSYTYQWYDGGGNPIPGETNSLISGLCAGNYTIEITDAGGCISTMLITLTEPSGVTSPITGTDVLCFGDCTGTATVNPSGGFAPYIVNWYNSGTGLLIGQSGNTASSLCPNDYHAVITDNNGCNFTTPVVSVGEPPELTWTINSNDASCFGVCDGDAQVIPAGGFPGYFFEWLDIGGNPIVGGTTSSVSNLCAGNYTIEVIDVNGCTSGQQTVVIDENPEITGNIFTNNSTCGGATGSATVFATGGTGPYTYQWFDNLMVLLPGETANTILNIAAGAYFVEVTDAAGCTELFLANVSDSPVTTITWDAVNDPTCFGGSDGNISITVSGPNAPFIYTWNPGGLIDEDPTGLYAGNWTVQITDALGCINYYDTTLFDPAEILVTSNVTASDCDLCNGAIDITVTGGTGAATVIWNNSMTGTSINGLCSSMYEAQITDANGCQVLEQVDVPNNGGLTGDQTVTAISCGGVCDGEITVSGIGGNPPYSYYWLHDGSTSSTQSNLCAGSYFVTITDFVGCTYSMEIEMNEPNAIDIETTITNPSCGNADGSITVTSSGGILPHTYLWNTLAVTPSVSNLSAGVYIVTVTDASGCAQDFEIGLSNSDAPIATVTSNNISCASLCDGQADTTSVVGGTPPYSFQWLDFQGFPIFGETNPAIIALCEGDYTLQTTDNLGCVSFQSITVTEPDTILLNPLFTADPSCNGDCDGQLVANPIGGTLPFTFLWDNTPASTTVNADSLCDGTYNLTITDANGCSIIQTGIVSEPTPITIVQDSIIDATCYNSTDGEVYITISGGTPGYTSQWISQTMADTLNTEDITTLMPLGYYLTVTDANGCIAMDTAVVDTVINVLAFVGMDTLICYGDSIPLYGYSNVDPLASLTWYDTTFANVYSVTNEMVPPTDSAGTFTYIFTANYLTCTHADTIVVTVLPSYTVDAGPDVEMYSQQEHIIGGNPTSSDPNLTYTWSPPYFLDDTTAANPYVIEPTSSNWYFVTATDANGCNATDSMYVLLLPDLVIPDGISPDGDGKNDTWILDFIEMYPGVDIEINVYNRWGEILFTADETYADDWGGTTRKGKRLPAGTYYYTIVIDHEDFPDPFTGPITIMW
ncbi:gliding motility-associated C-terminal domain-containing protein [Paracrocinitomix mangrovi]|uniref:T9SS type B sorting domain-containing protein n=1 Tax=Paracrocinitomix mangrovi TaxID=2862509 RepID=UPI001C8D6C8A|nr:gliding motility-associated C-terminal domain-containing protein [Paracrocinitomix mangrovi]UKN00524.1 gliding motility-associated C-terminal domain-containing protein [Paracrocinitomix mangrovi]